MTAIATKAQDMSDLIINIAGSSSAFDILVPG
jgi:hypothetical protein